MNHLGFVVSLPNLDIQTEVTAPPLTILTKRLQILMTVDIRLADTKTAKIRPIDDKNTTRHTFTFLRSDDIGLVDIPPCHCVGRIRSKASWTASIGGLSK